MLQIISIGFHRNGIEGEPFYSVRFLDGKSPRFGIITDRKGSSFVFDPTDHKFGFHGDQFEKTLRDWIVDDYARIYKLSIPDAQKELNDGLTDPVY